MTWIKYSIQQKQSSKSMDLKDKLWPCFSSFYDTKYPETVLQDDV